MMYGNGPGYFPLPAEGLTPLQILKRIASRRWLLLGVMAAVFACLALVIFRLQPLYTASAELVIEQAPGQSTNPLAQAMPLTADREKVLSEVQVLLSRGLAEKAVREFGLEEKPEFNPGLTKSFLRTLTGDSPAASEVLDRFAKRLKVYQVGTSRVIAVEFTASDPVLARDVANRMVDLYLDEQREARANVNAQASGWLAQQIDALRNRVAESEEKAEEFRARSGLLEGNGVQLQAQQLSELNTQLSAARAARAEAEARAASLERYAASNGADSGAESNAQVLQSPLIQQLRQQEVQVKRELSELSAELLPTHPRMVQKQAELDNLQGQIRAEIGKVVASVRSEAQIAAAREANADRELRALEVRRAVADRDQIQLRALEREAAANRSVLESFLARYTEVSTRGGIAVQETNARVISRAVVPDVPSFPQRGPMLVLAAMIGLGCGLGAVFIAEVTNRTVRHVKDIELVSGVPVLAALPAVAAPQDEALRRPGGAFAYGLRLLHAGLGIMPAGERRGRIVAVTSTARGEGRTTTAIGFARSMAQAGLRVLLVDADFAHPGLERIMGRKLEWGFRDLVMGAAGFDHVIARDTVTSAHIISAGHAYRGSVLTSPRLRPVLQALVHAYDVVVLDCEPAASADAQLLMRLADQCLYAVRWNATDRERAAANVRYITAARGRGGLGVVVTGAEQSQIA